MLRATRLLRQHIKPVKYVPPSERAVKEHREFEGKKKRNERLAKYLQYSFGAIVGTSLLMYLWQPWNPYSVPVSKDLRKGLWEERDKHENYLEALKHYQLALKAANEEGMDQLSLEYTGIVLKVAEMYQNLKMNDKLIDTYYKLSEFIFLNLLEGKREISKEQRDLLIDRDLIVITRWAMLMEEENKSNWVEKVEAELKDRMVYIETQEIPARFPWLFKNSDSSPQSQKQPDLIDLISIWSDPTLKGKWIDDYVPNEEGKEFLRCWSILRSFANKDWPLWIKSYLVLREFYADLEMRKHDYLQTIPLLQSNILWSIVGDIDSNRNIDTQILNLASSWFEYGQSTSSQLALDRAESIYLKLSDSLKNMQDQAPNLAMTYYSLGVLYQKQGKQVESQKYFSMARDLSLDLGLTQIVENITDHAVISDNIAATSSSINK